MEDIMDKKFENLVIEKEKLETEKLRLGGAIYKNRNLLPSLIITEDNFKKITEDLEMIKKICHQFSEDIVRLHADLFCNYGFNENHEKNQCSPIYSIINEIAVPLVAKLSIAKEQSEDGKRKVNAELIKTKESTIYGDEYCFISIILNELFPTYTGLVSLMLGRTYFDENYLKVIKERMNFLIHPFYEELRKNFKVVEILRIIPNPLHSELDSITIH